MIIGVVGAGAVGGFFGSKLQQAGNHVIFLARGVHLDVMQKKGMTVMTEAGNFTVDGSFTSEATDLCEADILLFTVKSTDSKDTAEKILPYLKEEAVIITLQNGVSNEEILQEVFGKDRVLSGVAYISANVTEPGVIRQSGVSSLVIGGLSDRGMERARQFVEVFQAAGVECKLSGNILERKWNKLLWNVTFNPLSAVSQATVGELLDDPYSKAAAERILDEAVRVGRALGVSIQPNAIDRVFTGAEMVRAHKTSMLQDRERGKKMEIEALCGYFVHKGAEVSVKTPIIDTLYGILRSMEKKQNGVENM